MTSILNPAAVGEEAVKAHHHALAGGTISRCKVGEAG